MFDLSKLTEILSGLLGASPVADAMQSQGVSDLLQNVGLDPSVLEGLAPDQVMELLAQHGIDPMQLAPDQLTELLQGLGASEGLGEVASRFFDTSRN